MLRAIVFLGILVIGSGGVAYVGDLIGRRMGKARLTLFGMRPRHTAVLITTVTGMLIAFLTLTILLASDKPLRKVIFRGMQILAENRTLQQDNESLSRTQRVLEKQAEKSRLLARKADAERRSADGRLKSAQQRLKALSDRIAVQQKELAAAAARLTREQLKLESVQAQREVAERSLRAAQTQLRQTQTLLSSARREAAEAAKAAIQARREANVALLEKEISIGSYEDLLNKPANFTAGEEVARGVVTYSHDFSVVRRAIVGVLAEASHAAIDRGASVASNGRAVVIPNVVAAPGAGKESFTEDDQINALRDEIVDGGANVVLQIIAKTNSVPGKPVLIQVRPYADNFAFAKGETLACTQLDASRNAEDLAGNIINFLATSVRSEAEVRDLIPRIKVARDPEDPSPLQKRYFEMDATRLAALVQRVIVEGGRVTLCAQAAADTTSAGPLSLVFSVKPAEP
ncbi:MAG: DUF3084 domain-containing protein [Armatimonadetes bacterium]|nr:DUF3084 domain-containing protein [Armatimonadota bacterium]